MPVTTVEWGGRHGRGDGKAPRCPRTPDGHYAHSGEVALGAVRTLRRAGLRVPQDVSVIGIDDRPLAELTDLSTGQPVREQGEIAGRMVLARLRGEEIEHGVPVPTQLVVRGRTAPPRNQR